MRRGAGVLLVAGALLVAAAPGRALAHAELLSSDPPAGLVLQAAPVSVSLRFSEPVTPIGSGIEVIAPSGRPVQSGEARASGTALGVQVRSQETGTYLVLWKVVSADTHPSRGTFTFSVGAAGPAPAGPQEASDLGAVTPLGLALQALGRWVHFLGFALLLGPLWLWLFALPREEPLQQLITAGAALVVAGGAVSLLGEAASLGPVDEASMADVLGSSFGRVLALQAGAALAAWMLLGAVREEPRARFALLAPAALLALVDGASGHLLRDLPAPAAWLLNGVHVAAMAAWVGALAAMLRFRLPAAALARPAAGLFAVLAASGLLLALAHLRGPADLVFSAYGAVLLAKTAAVGAAALLAALASRRLELAALAAVAALAALLTSLPQPR